MKCLRMSMNKKTSLSLTKEKYLFYYKFDLYSNDFYFNDFSVFGFIQLTVAVEWILLNLYDRKYLSLETASAYIFSTNNRN